MKTLLVLLCALACSARAETIAAVSRSGNVALIFASNSANQPSRCEIWTLLPWQRRCVVRKNLAAAGEISAAFSRDGRWVALGCIDSTIEIYDARSGKLRARLGDVHPETRHLSGLEDSYAVVAVAFSPDGETLAAGNVKGAFFWDWRHKKLLFSRPLRQRSEVYGCPYGPLHAAYLHVMQFSPDGKTLAISGQDSALFLFDVAQKRVRRSLILHAEEGGAQALAFSLDGRRLLSVGIWAASGASFDQIQMFRVANGRALWRWNNQPKNPRETGIAIGYERAAFAADGRRVAVASSNRLEIRDARTSRLLSVRSYGYSDSPSPGTQKRVLHAFAVF